MAVAKPMQMLEAAGNAGKLRAETTTLSTLVLGFLAGAYIAFGGALMITVVSGIPKDYLTLAKFVGGALFPVGLIIVIIGGADLFTGDVLYNTVGYSLGKMSLVDVIRNWILAYVGNFIGSIFIAYLLVASGLFASAPWLPYVQKLAVTKTSLSFGVAFWRGVGCNWLVCLACWLALASDDVMGKVIGIWFPIMAFVAMGFEHSIANMFFIPLGIFLGAPVTWQQFIVNNEIPVTLGNIVGGAIFCGAAYLISYRKNKTESVAKGVKA